MMVCPVCRSGNIQVFYTSPPQFECECGAKLRDLNAHHPGISVMSSEKARRKRPLMYGDVACLCCPHAPHDGRLCEFCEEDKAEKQPHVYDLAEIQVEICHVCGKLPSELCRRHFTQRIHDLETEVLRLRHTLESVEEDVYNGAAGLGAAQQWCEQALKKIRG